MRAYTHRSWAYQQRVSTTFLTRKNSFGSRVRHSTNWATLTPDYGVFRHAKSVQSSAGHAKTMQRAVDGVWPGHRTVPLPWWLSRWLGCLVGSWWSPSAARSPGSPCRPGGRCWKQWSQQVVTHISTNTNISTAICNSCVCVCMCVCVRVCVCACVHACVHACLFVHMCSCLSKCTFLCKYIVVFCVVCNCAPFLFCDGISVPYKYNYYYY